MQQNKRVAVSIMKSKYLVINENFDHVTQRVAQLHVVVTSVAELIEGELNCPLNTELNLNCSVKYNEQIKRREHFTVSSSLIFISSDTIVHVTYREFWGVIGGPPPLHTHMTHGAPQRSKKLAAGRDSLPSTTHTFGNSSANCARAESRHSD